MRASPQRVFRAAKAVVTKTTAARDLADALSWQSPVAQVCPVRKLETNFEIVRLVSRKRQLLQLDASGSMAERMGFKPNCELASLRRDHCFGKVGPDIARSRQLRRFGGNRARKSKLPGRAGLPGTTSGLQVQAPNFPGFAKARLTTTYVSRSAFPRGPRRRTIGLPAVLSGAGNDKSLVHEPAKHSSLDAKMDANSTQSKNRFCRPTANYLHLL